MSELNRYRIQRFKKNILDDIQEDVIEELQKLNVLTKFDMDSINNKKNFKEKMEHFLDIILNKSPSDVEHFISSLKVWYSWLYDLINNYKSNLHSIKLHDDLIRGGVPPLPHRNITRTELVSRIREKLFDLERNHYLVIHGMLGCGKTSLATEALNCEQIRKICDGQIFWIPVGSEGEKNILTLQESLNAILPEPELNLSDDVNVALIRLQRRFSEWDKGRRALIILDDVHSEKVINYLSVGTKFLVTTEDENVISSQRRSITTFEKIPDGFEEVETLSLFASAIGIKTHDLPSQAKLLHKYCKGHPMIISLISAQLEDHREQALAVSSRWDYYVELFSNKDLKRRSFDENQTLNNAIKSTIESLSHNRREYFDHFALFVEEVNIRPEVLAIIWSIDKHDVENIVMEFVRKSLVVRKWNAQFNSYVYGVHYIILRYLIINLSKDRVQVLVQF